MIPMILFLASMYAYGTGHWVIGSVILLVLGVSLLP
jgi:hypothetical protein